MGSEQARKPTTIELEEGWAEMQVCEAINR